MKKHFLLFATYSLLFTFAQAQQVQWTTTTASGDTIRPVKSTQGVLVPFLKFADGTIQATVFDSTNLASLYQLSLKANKSTVLTGGYGINSVGDLSTNRTISSDTTNATATSNRTGYLSYSDWNIFNNKQEVYWARTGGVLSSVVQTDTIQVGAVGINTATIDPNGVNTLLNARALNGLNAGIEITGNTSDANNLIQADVSFSAASNVNGSNGNRIANIRAITSGTTSLNRGGDLIFGTKLDGLGMTEKLRVSASGLITFGGVTSAFPALKRSSTELQVRLGDDSGYAPLVADVLTLYGAARTVYLNANTPVFQIGTGDLRFTFGTSGTGTDKVRFTSDGDVRASRFEDFDDMGYYVDPARTDTAVKLAGIVLGANGSSGLPAYSFASETNSGWYRNGPNDFRFSVGGGHKFGVDVNGVNVFAPLGLWGTTIGFINTGGQINSAGGIGTKYIRFSAENPGGSIHDVEVDSTALTLRSDFPLAWSSTATATGVADLFLYRDAANTLAQSNGTNAQSFNIYGTYTDPSDYERLQIVTRAGAYSSITQSEAGTGVARHLALETIGSSDLLFRTNNVLRWKINASGVLLAEADNLYSVGVSTGNRPSSIFARNSLNVQKYDDSYAFIADTNQVKASSGSKTMPGYSFVNATNSGIYWGGTELWLSVGGFNKLAVGAAFDILSPPAIWGYPLVFTNIGAEIHAAGSTNNKYFRIRVNPGNTDVEIDSTAFTLRSDYPLAWSSTTNAQSGTPDLEIQRDAEHVLGVRGGLVVDSLSNFSINAGTATIGAGDSVQVFVNGLTTSGIAVASYETSTALPADTAATWNIHSANTLTLYGKFGWVIGYFIGKK